MKSKKTEQPAKTDDAAPVKQAKHKTKAAAKEKAADAKASKAKSKGKYSIASPFPATKIGIIDFVSQRRGTVTNAVETSTDRYLTCKLQVCSLFKTGLNED